MGIETLELENAQADYDIELFFIRHAESEVNVPSLDYSGIGGRSNSAPLTETGHQQAYQLGAFLGEHGLVPDLVFSSPAKRTLQTAINSLGNVILTTGIIQVDDLQELDKGEWTGKHRREVYTHDIFRQMVELGLDFAAPGGETQRQTGDRMAKWLVEGLAEFGPVDGRPLRVFAFTHGDAVRCLTGKLLGLSSAEVGGIEVPKVSMTRLTRKAGEWTLHYAGQRTVV